jgi:glycosyltransferase involved in cell wall biosynthesis
LFSVIITTFNRDKFLKRAFNSVINQSEKPKEIIIINNGNFKYKSNDFIYNKNFKIKLIIINNKKNLFPAKARNLGAGIAKHKYVCFLDDDDKWEINYLKEAMNILKKKKPDLILSKIFIGKKIFKDPTNFSLNDILIKNPGVTGSNIIINKKTFFQLNGYDSNLEPSEDKSIVIEALIKNKRIIISKKKVFFSNHNQTRLTTNNLKLSIGVKNFYKKYNNLMSLNQKIHILNRINIYNLKLFKVVYLPYFIFIFILNKILN